MKAIEVTTSDDKLTMYVSLPSTPPVKLSLDAEHADKLIQALLNERGGMLPHHPMDLPAGTKVQVVADPRWATHPDALGGGTILHLRDPRVGWLHYVFPRDESKDLGKVMVSNSELPLAETLTSH